jgi:endonuclease/exonuclease/phosphatase family metal-dependent hydrolase
MRITSWNILHGQPITPNSDGKCGGLERAIAVLGSDLIALQEVDFGLERSGRAEQSAEIATYANSNWWGLLPQLARLKVMALP